MGLNKITREHISLCISLHIPFAFVVTKLDLCENRQKAFDETMTTVQKIAKMPTVDKMLCKIKDLDDVILCANNISHNSIIPLFQTSNVSGEGLDLLKSFLNLVPSKSHIVTDKVEMQIDAIFNVSGTGVVVGGYLKHGKISVGDKLYLGPDSLGEYHHVQIKSLHCKKINVTNVTSIRYVCIAFRKVNKQILRKGLVLLSEKVDPVYEFNAEITVYRTNKGVIRTKFEPIVHCGSIRQAARIIQIMSKTDSRTNETTIDDCKYLSQGDSGIVRLRFKFRPEFIKVGDNVCLCDSHVKVVGKIVAIL
jgi:GTPase